MHLLLSKFIGLVPPNRGILGIWVALEHCDGSFRSNLYISGRVPCTVMRAVPKCLVRPIEDLCASQTTSHDIVISCFLTAKSIERLAKGGGAGWWTSMHQDIHNAITRDSQVKKEVTSLPTLSPRVVLSPVSSLLKDTDDVRRIAEAVRAGLRRARQTGSCSNPLILFPDLELLRHGGALWEDMSMALPVACLAAMTETYQAPDQFPGCTAGKTQIPSSITLAVPQEFIAKASANGSNAYSWEQLSQWIESGRQLARDIGGGDPEFMTPMACAKEIHAFFSQHAPNVSVKVVDSLDVLKREYPLLYAVSRASLHVQRHHPCVVKLEYDPGVNVDLHLYLVGKGICYDTGGADLKVGGAMVGMSRDKCGAAAVAGFMAVVGQAKPAHLKVSASLAFVRNSIGSDSYVSDEIIMSRAGQRVRVGNTDAEGRMVMTDLLAEMKERAVAGKCGSLLMTCATLTGHAGRAMGPYPICIDNLPAKRLGVSKHMSRWGAAYGEPWECSNLRREDYNMNVPNTGTGREDLVQCNTQPSTMTARGHQFPAAFMMAASGVDKHSGRVSDDYMDELAEGRVASVPQPLAYTHMDIAAAAEESGPCGKLTGAPVVTLTAAFLLHPLSVTEALLKGQ